MASQEKAMQMNESSTEQEKAAKTNEVLTGQEKAARIIELLEAQGYGMSDFAVLIRSLNETDKLYEGDKQQTLKWRISNILKELGIPQHIKGYEYVRTAIEMTYQNPELLNSVTNTLYPNVANKYNTTGSRVERAIRHGIEVAWNRGDLEILQKYFGYTISQVRGKPTNSEFIATIVDMLRLQDGK